MLSDDTPLDDLESALAVALGKVAHLERAVESHELVGQACGILMALHRISGGAAFAALLRVSQHRNVRIRDLAEAIIELIASPSVVPTSPATTAALELLPRDGGNSAPDKP